MAVRDHQPQMKATTKDRRVMRRRTKAASSNSPNSPNTNSSNKKNNKSSKKSLATGPAPSLAESEVEDLKRILGATAIKVEGTMPLQQVPEEAREKHFVRGLTPESALEASRRRRRASTNTVFEAPGELLVVQFFKSGTSIPRRAAVSRSPLKTVQCTLKDGEWAAARMGPRRPVLNSNNFHLENASYRRQSSGAKKGRPSGRS